MSNFFDKLRDLLKSDRPAQVDVPDVPKKENVIIPDPPYHTYKKDYKPLRQLFIWGYDNENNPSFLILYGYQNFINENYGENRLENHVNYTGYAIFRGSHGHFPSFESVKIIDRYDYRTQKHNYQMYHTKDLQGYWYYGNPDKSMKDYVALKENSAIKIPYFNADYETQLSILKEHNITFKNFRPADSKHDVLGLSSELEGYCDILCDLFGNPNLYTRKKKLKELIGTKPDKSVYQYLMEKGSTEVISGLFLELALQRNNCITEEAYDLLKSVPTWSSESYTAGLIRCARLYVSTFDEEQSAARIQLIRDTLPELSLRLISVDGKQIPEDHILEGINYRKYSLQGFLTEYTYRYIPEKRKSVQYRREGLYKKGYYCDGVVFDIQKLKHTIQEAEIYQLADVIGKIAYYLDAPSLTYYLKGTSKHKALNYFRRYVRRIIDSYAQNDESKFMEAMKSLLTSYTPSDYLCKFKGNFQFNYFIKHYLYFDFKEKAPESWTERAEWMRNDQLLRLKGRFEYMPGIWDRNIEAMLLMLPDIKLEVVVKALYHILKDCEKEVLDSLPYSSLLSMAECMYQPIAEMALSILTDKISQETVFENGNLHSLMHCNNDQILQLALEYFLKLPEQNYIAFLQETITDCNTLPDSNIFNQILELSKQRFAELNEEKQKEIAIFMITQFICKNHITKTVADFMEHIVFSLSLTLLNDITAKLDLQIGTDITTAKAPMLITLLQSVKNNTLLADYHIKSILETASSPAINIFTEIAVKHKDLLAQRDSTLLLYLESELVSLNEISKAAFTSYGIEDKTRLLLKFFDSPDEKTYRFGIEMLQEIYKIPQDIPEQFLIHMLEHPSREVKAYISDKLTNIVKDMADNHKDLFLYYTKTVLYLPNKESKAKHNIYDILPRFVVDHRDKQEEVEQLLLNLGSSNIILDSERALVTLAKIKKEVSSFEG